jgi:hypothetical protein
MSSGTAPNPGAAPSPPKIYKAILGAGGDVIRGAQITEAEAATERQAGRDVVVCGQILLDNYSLAAKIERAANGGCRACPPHYMMGPGAMFHFHADPRPPDGHCFYETVKRKSKKKKTAKKP